MTLPQLPGPRPPKVTKKVTQEQIDRGYRRAWTLFLLGWVFVVLGSWVCVGFWLASFYFTRVTAYAEDNWQ